jgi:hypothetical protein
LTERRNLNAAAAGAIRTAAVLFLALVLTPATARELVVKATPCAATIEVSADGVPLDEILRAVTAALGVRLEAKTALPELTRFKASGTPERVLLKLMQGRSVVLDSKPVGKCGGGETLTTVWILPTGEAAAPRPEASVTLPAAVQAPGEAELRPLRAPRPRGTRKRLSEDEWRKAKADWEAGKVQADPVTGLPVPVPQPATPEGQGQPKP